MKKYLDDEKVKSYMLLYKEIFHHQENQSSCQLPFLTVLKLSLNFWKVLKRFSHIGLSVYNRYKYKISMFYMSM